MMYKHIIWDFDGTLFDTYPAMTAAMLYALQSIGIIESSDNILALMKVSMTHMQIYMEDIYGIDESFWENYKQIKMKFEDHKIQPFDGAIEICQYIVEQNGYNHLFTHRGNSAISYLEKNGLLPLFTGLITKEKGFERKPSPEGIHYLLEEYMIPKNDALMIGDREIDLLSAKNAGIHACYFNPRNDRPLDCADYTISTLLELKPILMNKASRISSKKR